MYHLKTSLICCVLGIISVQLNAQTLSGKVRAESGLYAAGVTVSFANKVNTVTTNKDGTFKITATKLPDTLLFSAVGYEPYKVVINEKNIHDPDFEVVLLAKRDELNEVVVVGYSSTARKEHTYAAASVARSVSDRKKRKSGDIALAGRTAGLSVESGTSLMKASTTMRSSAVAVDGESGMYTTSSDKSKVVVMVDTLAKSTATSAAKLLTAGEVNDFTKWNLWDDYTDNTFKVYSEGWGLYTKKRYTVQVQNKELFAAVGKKVYLINRTTKDTVWQAITDNTGKAELWANFNGSSKDEMYTVGVMGGNELYKAYAFEEGINRLQVNEACAVSNKVDIAFVVDATGSMGDELEFLKLELEDVLQKTFAQYNSLSIRAASVFYKDAGDDYVTKYNSFNAELLKTLNFIKLQKAGGGGDMPEAVDAALDVALNTLQWDEQARTRIMFLILDAPPHAEAKNKIQAYTKLAAAMGIKIVPIVCSGADKNTEFLMRSIALATNGTYLFLTNDSGIGDAHIKPTTDNFSVELLNNLLPRVIQQMIHVQSCTGQQQEPPVKIRTVVKMMVSPNPSRGDVTITSDKPLREIFITDFTGKILQRLVSNAKQTQWKVNIAHYPAGTYLVRYITEDNQLGAEKIILIH